MKERHKLRASLIIISEWIGKSFDACEALQPLTPTRTLHTASCFLRLSVLLLTFVLLLFVSLALSSSFVSLALSSALPSAVVFDF